MNITLFCHISKLCCFGLVTGHNVEWYDSSENNLLNNINLFSVNILYTMDLCANNFRFKSYDKGISYNEFEPISKQKLLNWDIKSCNDIDLLKNLKVKNKMIECLNNDISNLFDTINNINQTKRDLRHKYNVCMYLCIVFNVYHTESPKTKIKNK